MKAYLVTFTATTRVVVDSDENPNDNLVLLTATKNSGYVFSNWTVGGAIVSTESKAASFMMSTNP